MSRPLVLLHGFSGDPGSFDAVQAALPAGADVFAPALLGHGTPDTALEEAAEAGVTGFDDEVDRLARLIAARAPDAHLVGYSLGGRLALGLLARHPALFVRATLIGAQPGLRTELERSERRHADEHLCQVLERLGIEVFVAKWESIPLFASQRALPEPVLARQRAARLRRDPDGLARSLRLTGLGAMPPYWDALGAIAVPVTLMAGGVDEKFSRIAREMAALAPRATVDIVPGVGHNVPLEAPDAVARAVREVP